MIFELKFMRARSHYVHAGSTAAMGEKANWKAQNKLLHHKVVFITYLKSDLNGNNKDQPNSSLIANTNDFWTRVSAGALTLRSDRQHRCIGGKSELKGVKQITPSQRCFIAYLKINPNGNNMDQHTSSLIANANDFWTRVYARAFTLRSGRQHRCIGGKSELKGAKQITPSQRCFVALCLINCRK